MATFIDDNFSGSSWLESVYDTLQQGPVCQSLTIMITSFCQAVNF